MIRTFSKQFLLVVVLHSLFILLTKFVAAQSTFVFNHLTVENGLSSGSVLSLTQDKKGFLWVGTMDGLNRYDGKKIKVFKSFYASNPIGPGLKINRLLTDRDQHLWIGTNNGLYLYDSSLDSFTVFFHNEGDASSISHNNVNALYLDKAGNVWVGTQKGLDKITKGPIPRFSHISLASQYNNTSFHEVQDILETGSGELFVGTSKGLLLLQKNQRQPQLNYSITYCLIDVSIRTIVEDKSGSIWAGSFGAGLFKLATNGNIQAHFIHQTDTNSLVSDDIRRILVDKENRIWVGTLKGLNVLHPSTGTLETYSHNAGDEKTLNFNSIYDIFEDRQGNIWIGTFFGGLNVAEALKTNFTIYKNEASETSLGSNVVSAILDDEKGNLWIGTEAVGLNYFDRKKGIFRRIQVDETQHGSLSSNLVKTLMRDKYNRVWVGMFNGGINIIDGSGKRIGEFTVEGSNPLSSRHVTALLQDNNDRVWIGTEDRGVDLYDYKTGKISKFEKVFPGRQLPNVFITCLYRDSKQNIWVGTRQGLSRFEPQSGQLINFFQKDYDGQLQSDYINYITEDSKGTIWIGTYSGLSCFHPQQKKFQSFTIANGLAGNKVLGIVEDDANNLWISTNNGLCRLDSSRKQFHSFTVADGLPGNVFNYQSVFKDQSGQLFFGGYKGLVEFNPKEIRINTMPPVVQPTALSINGKIINPGDSSKLLTNNISETTKLRLAYDQNTIVLDYAVMNFIKPEKNRSAYKLQGFNDDWVYTDQHFASFVNLPPGNYFLFIKGSNNDGVWGEPQKVLQIRIAPPPWKSWWAYCLYIIFILGIVVGTIYFFVSRAALRRKLHYEHMVNIRQQELHQMKIDFFTHISHELRTPLTLISGPVELLANKVHGNEKKLVQIIKANADRLLKLTTDLLDFRKADAGHTQLTISPGDIVSFSRNIHAKFTSAAAGKNIHCTFHAEEPIIELYFDPDHMEIVLSNLLSNAIKFTPEGGRVTMEVRKSNNKAEIIVCDNGVGIAKESQEKIFSSFYQANAGAVKHAGSGIGLAFSKSLVELHGGELSFYSTQETNSSKNETCFTVMLPLGNSHFKGKNINFGMQKSN